LYYTTTVTYPSQYNDVSEEYLFYLYHDNLPYDRMLNLSNTRYLLYQFYDDTWYSKYQGKNNQITK